MKEKNYPGTIYIKKWLEKSQKLIKCEFGKSELEYYCSLAHRDQGGRLLCSAIYNWSDNLEVEGLNKCFLTARFEYKLSVSNRRRKAAAKKAAQGQAKKRLK